MDIIKIPSSTYWFVLGLLRAKLDDEDFKYVELIISESLIGGKPEVVDIKTENKPAYQYAVESDETINFLRPY